MERTVDAEIVIVGGGICGLATALALHRKRVRSLVLERSEKLRATGAAIIVQANGWRALDQLGVGATLRQTAIQIQGNVMVMSSPNNGDIYNWNHLPLQPTTCWGKFISLSGAEPQEIPFEVNQDFRCLRRTDLIKAMANSLPAGTIRTRCQVLSIELDPVTQYPKLLLSNGSIFKAKVVIGCDGVNSTIANMVGLDSTKLLLFSTCVARGFTNYPNGHQFASEFVVISRGQVQLGRIPVTDVLVYWFVTRPRTSRDSIISKDPVLIRQSLMESLKGFPVHAIEMIRNCKLNSLHLTDLKYRPPWDLLLNNFRKGTVTVAGDAMHATGPFIAQGGSASIEDAVVLARCLAQKMHTNKKVGRERYVVEEAFGQYVKERKTRILWLSLHTFLIGKKLDTRSLIGKLIIISIMAVLFRDPDGHTHYDCGTL